MALNTASSPIVLKLKHINPNNTTPIRTNPTLFQNVLGLQPGQNFSFDFDKWRSLKASYLFHNLSARSVLVDEDNVRLEISGYELPNRKITPEASVTASLTRPEITGGVAFQDRNLFGLGHTLEGFFAKKEGTEAGTDDLTPMFRIKWSECPIGASTTLSAGIEQEESFESLSDVTPRVGSLVTRNGFDRRRIESTFQRLWLKVTGADFSVEPYTTKLITRASAWADATACTLHGLVGTLRVQEPVSGSVAKFVMDDGVTFSKGKSATFRLLKLKLAFPQIRSLIRTPSFGRNASQELFTSIHTRVDISRAAGAGLIPLRHLTKLGESRLLRGFTSGATADLEERSGTHAVVQSDLYIGNHLGLFVDGGAFSGGDSASEEIRKALSIGFSLRGQGLRLDCGLPVDKNLVTGRRISIPRVHVGMDNIHF